MKLLAAGPKTPDLRQGCATALSFSVTFNLMKKLLCLLLGLTASAYAQKFENLALTPPMGWNSWNTFASAINEKVVRETADTMVATGMRDCVLAVAEEVTATQVVPFLQKLIAGP